MQEYFKTKIILNVFDILPDPIVTDLLKYWMIFSF